MNRPQSARLYREALSYIAGGVNSPSRSFHAVGGVPPVFMKRAQGAYFWDADGNRYIDYLAAFGPLVLGHAHPGVTRAICAAAEDGVLYGTPTEWEVAFARRLQSLIPSMERIRFVNSGTEAVMSAIRLARAYTGRSKIIKFAGCYHGHADQVLVAAGSGPSTLGVPDSAGVPRSIAEEVITVPYNDAGSLQEAFARWAGRVAAVLVEPVVGNFGIVTPRPGFLESIHSLARAAGALVIYDEVITAFRFRYGAVQTMLGWEPDLTALGKIIGGGLPIGAYGGKQEIMEMVAPLGPVYQAGTMAGNPASVRAGMACLDALAEPGTYERMDALGAMLEKGLRDAAARRFPWPVTINRLGGALALYFGEGPVENYEHAQRTNGEQFAAFFHAMLERGIYLAPSKFEAWFISAAHTREDIERTVEAAEQAFDAMAAGAGAGTRGER